MIDEILKNQPDQVDYIENDTTYCIMIKRVIITHTLASKTHCTFLLKVTGMTKFHNMND